MSIHQYSCGHLHFWEDDKIITIAEESVCPDCERPVSVPTTAEWEFNEVITEVLEEVLSGDEFHAAVDRIMKAAKAYAASSSLLPVGRPCTACKGNHFDHTFVHFSLSNDLGGFCWEEDHYPNEGDILVTSNISEVTCPKCREYCRTLNDLKKSGVALPVGRQLETMPIPLNIKQQEVIHDWADNNSIEYWGSSDAREHNLTIFARQILSTVAGLPVGEKEKK